MSEWEGRGGEGRGGRGRVGSWFVGGGFRKEAQYRGGRPSPASSLCVGEVVAHIAVSHAGVHTRCPDDNLWSGAVEYCAGMHRTLAQAVYR